VARQEEARLNKREEAKAQPRQKREVYFREPNLSKYKRPDWLNRYSRDRDSRPERAYFRERRGRSPERRGYYYDNRRRNSLQRPNYRSDRPTGRLGYQSPSRYQSSSRYYDYREEETGRHLAQRIKQTEELIQPR
jgi:hypothetical protein